MSDKPLHTDEDFDRLRSNWDRSKGVSGPATYYRVVVAVIEAEGFEGYFFKHPAQPVYLAHSDGKTETIIGRFDFDERRYHFVPDGWSPPETLTGLHVWQLAGAAYRAYYKQVLKP